MKLDFPKIKVGLKCPVALSLLTVDSILNIGIEAIGLNSMDNPVGWWLELGSIKFRNVSTKLNGDLTQ